MQDLTDGHASGGTQIEAVESAGRFDHLTRGKSRAVIVPETSFGGVDDMPARIDAITAEMTGSARPNVDLVLARVMALTMKLPGVDHAGVTLIQDGNILRSLAATDGHPLVLDNIQRRYAEGPCFESATDNRTFRVDDLSTEGRWPDFVHKALGSTPVRAILSVPIENVESEQASLNLHADHAGALGAVTEDAALRIARHIGGLINVAQTSRQQRRSSRTEVISQANRVLMRRFNLDSGQSFALLVRMAKHRNESIEVVARTLIAEPTELPGQA
jgi:hypothetical protein